jgi:hypothetical protein
VIGMAAKQPEKPATYQNFEALTKQLLGVPKADLDQRMKTYDDAKAKRKKARRKKS